jgi:hypothetical protein
MRSLSLTMQSPEACLGHNCREGRTERLSGAGMVAGGGLEPPT